MSCFDQVVGLLGSVVKETYLALPYSKMAVKGFSQATSYICSLTIVFWSVSLTCYIPDAAHLLLQHMGRRKRIHRRRWKGTGIYQRKDVIPVSTGFRSFSEDLVYTVHVLPCTSWSLKHWCWIFFFTIFHVDRIRNPFTINPKLKTCQIHKISLKKKWESWCRIVSWFLCHYGIHAYTPIMP